MTGSRPWFKEFLAPSHPRAGELAWLPRGHIDIRSGKIRLTGSQDFMREPALDDWIPTGAWAVATAVRASSAPELGACLLRLSTGCPPTAWRPATADGAPARTPPNRILIGDADWSLTLGPERAALDFLTRGSQGVPGDWTWPDGSSSGPLLPTSRTSSYYSGAQGVVGAPRDSGGIGTATVWVGTDVDGEVCDIVVDLQAVREVPSGAILNAWAEPLSTVGAQVLPGTQWTPPEVADLTSAFEVTDDFVGVLKRLGDVSLAGRIAAYDPGTLTTPVVLPLILPGGRYPVYSVTTPELRTEDLLLLRFGDQRPVRWHEAQTDAPAWDVLMDTARYVVTQDSTLRRCQSEPPFMTSFEAAVDEVAHGVGRVSGTDVEFVLNGATMGDGFAWCYVGLDERDVASALVVCMLPDALWGVMPIEQDNVIFSELARRVSDGPLHDDEVRTYMWPALLGALEAEGGRFTRRVRAEMYALKDHIDNERE